MQAIVVVGGMKSSEAESGGWGKEGWMEGWKGENVIMFCAFHLLSRLICKNGLRTPCCDPARQVVKVCEGMV